MANFDEIGWQAESKTGVVAAGGAGAVAAGISILDQGGNAADAAVATILALNVTDHGACSIGGEVPVLLWDGNQVKSLSGMGRAPRKSAKRQKEFAQVPVSGMGTPTQGLRKGGARRGMQDSDL